MACGADFAGLVFHPASPRAVTPEVAGSLAAYLRGRTQIVALLVNACDAEIDDVIAAVHPDFLQLHGNESPARVADIRMRFGIAVIRALAVSEAQDIDQPVRDYASADRFLFDAKAPAGATRTGGLGVPFDWRLLAGHPVAKPWFLAGGLTAENVAVAACAAGAGAVDVSSGVECAPGIKDPVKIAAFLAAVHNINPVPVMDL